MRQRSNAGLPTVTKKITDLVHEFVVSTAVGKMERSYWSSSRYNRKSLGKQYNVNHAIHSDPNMNKL